MIKDIPCTNPYNYCKVVEPIYEVHKINRKELTELACRSTHTIKARSSKIPENDNLYALFLKYTKYDITFMCNWLKTFMLANGCNFEIQAAKYLASKVLSYENWTDSISDRRKGDILALYGLCLLFNKHVLLHLHNGLVWTTMESLSENHQNDLEKCDLHLCYLGRGIFMELVKREVPLQVVDDNKPNVHSLIIGELTMEENLTYDELSHLGLGVAVDHTQSVENTNCHQILVWMVQITHFQVLQQIQPCVVLLQ